MKSKLYRKYRIGKVTFPTREFGGSNGSGKLVVGSEAALTAIEQKLGRKLIVVKTDHTNHQWVFCEKKGTQRSQPFAHKFSPTEAAKTVQQ